MRWCSAISMTLLLLVLLCLLWLIKVVNSGVRIINSSFLVVLDFSLRCRHKGSKGAVSGHQLGVGAISNHSSVYIWYRSNE